MSHYIKLRGNQVHYIKDTQVAERYSTCRATIWRWVRTGKFPAPIKIGEGCTRWKLSDIEEWEKKKVSKHD